MTLSGSVAVATAASGTTPAGSPLRALLLTWDFPPVRGGIQTWMFEFANRLPDADVTAMTAAAPDSIDPSVGGRVVRLRSSRFGRRLWLAHLAVVVLIRSLVRRPDLIVCGHVVTVPAALLPAWLLRVPIVTFVYAWEIRHKRQRRILSFLLNRAALVLASSRFTERELLLHGVPEAVTPEPFGLAVAEALLMRKAVIATNHGGPTAVITDGKRASSFRLGMSRRWPTTSFCCFATSNGGARSVRTAEPSSCSDSRWNE